MPERKLLDIDTGRLADMDANGVDMHLLSMGLPGVQMFEPDSVSQCRADLSNHGVKVWREPRGLIPRASWRNRCVPHYRPTPPVARAPVLRLPPGDPASPAAAAVPRPSVSR